MAQRAYVKRYFDRHAGGWVADAYAHGATQAAYPVGAHRVRLALQLILERLGRQRGELVDLGCGGGQLCLEAARLRFGATGIDVAPGMITEATRTLARAPAGLRTRLQFIVGDALKTRLPSGQYGVVAGLGLIEYLPGDRPLFQEAFRLLKPGGVLVLSCRNRLFNMASLNAYTGEEIARGAAGQLLEELSAMSAGRCSREAFAEFITRLTHALPALRSALVLDVKARGNGPRRASGVPPFDQTRRQHTPKALWRSAQEAGFESPSFVSAHPHPLPPALEVVAPRFFNQLASVYETFEREPSSVAWSSVFLGAFTKPC